LINKRKNALVPLLEGPAVLIFSFLVFDTIFARLDITLPKVSAHFVSLSLSALSTASAVAYLSLRCGFLAKVVINRFSLGVGIAAVVILWLFVFFFSIVVGAPRSLWAQSILSSGQPFKAISIFLATLWVPFFEELLFRGYILELLKDRINVSAAVIVSSIVFVFLHLTSGYPNIELFLTFSQSVLYSITYLYGGIVPAFMVHACFNLYLLIL